MPATLETQPHNDYQHAEMPAVSAEISDQPAREWALVSGAVLHELGDPEVQDTLSRFVTAPVNEDLPKAMLDTLPSTPLLDRVRSSTNELDAFAALPAIDDSRLVPDLTGASPLRGGDKISIEEHHQVAERYRFARDVKLLALGAELQRLGEERPQPDVEGHITLPSGITMGSDPTLGEESLILLDPTKWEGREQLKDRVYKIGVNGTPYILKEEKTSRHTDTSLSGHELGLSPAEEYEVGQTLNKEATIERNGVRVEFERPLGYVEYPDGFKFAIYEYKDGIIKDESTSRTELTNAILEHPERFQEEYEATARIINEGGYKDIRATELAPGMSPRGIGGNILTLLGVPRRRLRNSTLSYEDFAAAKAAQMHITGKALLSEGRYMAGYRDNDDEGTVFRVDGESGSLSVIALDYEKYQKHGQTPSREKIAALMADKHHMEHRHSDGGLPENATAIQRAAIVALLEQDDARWNDEHH